MPRPMHPAATPWKPPSPSPDLHASALHQLGLDRERLSVCFPNLDLKLTGVEAGRVVKSILV